MILILSADVVAAALLGALIETLGYPVRFAQPPETVESSIRRVRPKVCLIDCEDPSCYNSQTLGRAAMRRISVVVFGTREALDKLNEFARVHDIQTLLVPPDAPQLEETLRTALQRAG